MGTQNQNHFGVTEIDFSDLRHGLKVLEQDFDDPTQRTRICNLLFADVAGLGRFSAAEDFRAAVRACGMFGAPLQPVKDAFLELLTACAGWSAAQAQIKKGKAVAAVHGRKGGRPKKEALAEQWTNKFDAKRKAAIPIPANEIYRDIASETGVKWTTVRDQISKHRKNNPPFDDNR